MSSRIYKCTQRREKEINTQIYLCYTYIYIFECVCVCVYVYKRKRKSFQYDGHPSSEPGYNLTVATLASLHTQQQKVSSNTTEKDNEIYCNHRI